MTPAVPNIAQYGTTGRDRTVPGSDARMVGALDVMAFLVELALMAALAVAGARLSSGPAACALAVMLPLLVAILWGLCLAPRAMRRLPHPWRLAGKLALVLTGAGLLAASGAALWGMGFLVVAAPLVTLGEFRPPGPRS